MSFKFTKSNLNFDVYAVASKPTTPGANNDIAIITSVPMPNWIMSPDKPSGIPRSDGDVWIQYSVTGNTFNALKNNSMMIATIKVWQYVDGAWVDVEAVSCQNGEWVEWWDGSLLMPGDEWEHITGGWVADKNFQRVESHTNMVAPTVTKDSGSITLTMMTGSYGGSYHTQNKVDVSRFKTLKIDIESATCGNGYLVFFLQDTLGNDVYHNSAANAQILGDNKTSFNGTCSINVESITGEFYIGLSLSTFNSGAMTVEFTKIYLE